MSLGCVQFLSFFSVRVVPTRIVRPFRRMSMRYRKKLLGHEHDLAPTNFFGAQSGASMRRRMVFDRRKKFFRDRPKSNCASVARVVRAFESNLDSCVNRNKYGQKMLVFHDRFMIERCVRQLRTGRQSGVRTANGLPSGGQTNFFLVRQ